MKDLIEFISFYANLLISGNFDKLLLILVLKLQNTVFKVDAENIRILK